MAPFDDVTVIDREAAAFAKVASGRVRVCVEVKTGWGAFKGCGGKASGL